MTDSLKRSERVDRVLSIAAGVAALCAVAISWYQAELLREQQRASAWPYLAHANSWVPGKPYVRTIVNQGVGPARVRSFAMLVDSRVVNAREDVVRALTGAPAPELEYSSLGTGHVLPPGEVREVLRLPDDEQARAFWQAAQTRLATVVCYCSVYDECWRSDSRVAEPEGVASCPAGATGVP